MRRTPLLAAATLAGAALLAAAAGGTPAKEPPRTHAGPAVAALAGAPRVTAQVGGFRPARIVVGRRALVRFRNLDGFTHNAAAVRRIAGRRAFRSGRPTTGPFRVRAPARPGAYRYVCEVHPLTMRGTLVVRPPA